MLYSAHTHTHSVCGIRPVRVCICRRPQQHLIIGRMHGAWTLYQNSFWFPCTSPRTQSTPCEWIAKGSERDDGTCWRMSGKESIRWAAAATSARVKYEIGIVLFIWVRRRRGIVWCTPHWITWWILLTLSSNFVVVDVIVVAVITITKYEVTQWYKKIEKRNENK